MERDSEHRLEEEEEDSRADSDDTNDTGSFSDGPMSLHLPALDSDTTPKSHDSEELSYLRLENALLKKKVKALERISRSERRNAKLLVDEAEMDRINELLRKAEDAKAEALDYVANTSRDKLGHEVKVLQSILQKAKAERHAFKKKIKAAEDKLLLERQKIEKEEVRFQIDREIFAKILKDDRDAYKSEVNLLVQKTTELQKEKHELFRWAKQTHERHLQEIRKLTRALGRTRKTVDEHKSQNEDVLRDAQLLETSVVAATVPPPSPHVAGAATPTESA